MGYPFVNLTWAKEKKVTFFYIFLEKHHYNIFPDYHSLECVQYIAWKTRQEFVLSPLAEEGVQAEKEGPACVNTICRGLAS